MQKQERQWEGDRKQCRPIQPTDLNPGWMDKWIDGNKGIKQMHRENPKGHESQKSRSTLGVLKEEIEKRNEKATDNQRDAQGIPRADIPAEEPTRFFRDIPIPNQNVLAKTDIAPEDRETKKQLTHHVIMLGIHKAQISGILES